MNKNGVANTSQSLSILKDRVDTACVRESRYKSLWEKSRVQVKTAQAAYYDAKQKGLFDENHQLPKT